MIRVAQGEAYEKAIKEIPDKADRAEIVERYVELVYPTCLAGRSTIRRHLNDLIDEVTKWT